MRAVAFALVALLLVTAMPADAALSFKLHRQMFGAGWWADRFTTQDTRLSITFEDDGTSETQGTLLYLYDGAGRNLFARTFVFLGGNRADVAVSASGVRVATDDLVDGDRIRPLRTVNFFCDATCNPSREFILVVSGSGDNLSAWGYVLFQDDFESLGGRSGEAAHSVPSRMFNGTVASAQVASTGEGVNVVRGGTLNAPITGTFIGSFVKFQGSAPAVMQLAGPNGAMSCSCSVSNGAPGMYTFRYEDTDLRGDEAYATWADITFP